MKNLFFMLIFSSATSLFAGTVLEGTNVLKKVDNNMNGSKDKTTTVAMKLIDSSNKTENREMLMYQKGDKKLIKFLKPSGVKGVGLLSLTDTQMYLYMPAFKRIRRIASSIKNDTFMGTDMSYNDMGVTNYADDYTVTSYTVKGKIGLLVLKPKKDDSAYSKLIMNVDLKLFMPSNIKFYNKSQKLWKELNASNFTKQKSYITIGHMEMKDLIKNHSTVMDIKNVKYDTKLGSHIFNKRFLKR